MVRGTKRRKFQIVKNAVRTPRLRWGNNPKFQQSSTRSLKEAELFGLFFVLRELHGGLAGEGEQLGDSGGLARFFEGFNNFGEEASAIDAVDFGAVEFAGGETKVGDEGAEFVVDHAGEDNAG